MNITTERNGEGTQIWGQGNGDYGDSPGLLDDVTFCILKKKNTNFNDFRYFFENCFNFFYERALRRVLHDFLLVSQNLRIFFFEFLSKSIVVSM